MSVERHVELVCKLLLEVYVLFNAGLIFGDGGGPLARDDSWWKIVGHFGLLRGGRRERRRVQHITPLRARWGWWASSDTVRTDMFMVAHYGPVRRRCVTEQVLTTSSHHTTTSEREQGDRGGRKAHLHRVPPWQCKSDVVGPA